MKDWKNWNAMKYKKMAKIAFIFFVCEWSDNSFDMSAQRGDMQSNNVHLIFINKSCVIRLRCEVYLIIWIINTVSFLSLHVLTIGVE
jgi:hypothetical protein